LENIDGVAVIGVPIAAGRRRVGVMVIDGDVLPDTDLLTSASLALAIAASRRDAEAAVVAERAAWLVSELRYGSTRETRLVHRSAERFGLNLDEPHAAAAFRYTGGNESSWKTAVRWIEMPTERRGDTAWTVIAGDGHAELRRIQDRLGGIVGQEGQVVAVCGSVVRSSTQTSRSFREAELLVELAVQRGVDLLTPAMSGIDTLLVSLDPVLLDRFVEDALRPILDSPRLIDTLEAWLDSEGSRAAVAETLFVHRNTVGYRLKRLHEMLDADLGDQRVRLRLQTAIAAYRLLPMIGTEPEPP
jgi:sugar diacid utilization regulator